MSTQTTRNQKPAGQVNTVLLLLRNVILVEIHGFHNGGPLRWSGNKSHHSEASKATVKKIEAMRHEAILSSMKYVE